MNDEKLERGVIQVPHEIAEEINNRNVKALRVNIANAKKLHEHGEEYAMSNNVDLALRAWVLWQITNRGNGVRDTIECVMELVIDCILPHMLKQEPLKTMAIREANQPREKEEADLILQVNDMLTDAGFTPIVAGGTLDEIIEQLQGLRESEGETRQ